MAIKFQAAPAAKEDAGEGGFDIAAVLDAGGYLNTAMLFVTVVVIYCIVIYLRSTPGYRVTDLKPKRKASKEIAVQRARAPERAIEPAE